MKLGLFATNMGALATPAEIAATVRAVEAAGFDSVWAGEHVILPDPQVPPSPMAPQDPALDPLLALAWAAAHTLDAAARDRHRDPSATQSRSCSRSRSRVSTC